MKSIADHIHNYYLSGQRLAHSEINKAIRRGDLPKPKDCVCADCGKQARAYDHRDYNAPLSVEPVCGTCNYRRGPAAWSPELIGSKGAPTGEVDAMALQLQRGLDKAADQLATDPESRIANLVSINRTQALAEISPTPDIKQAA